VAASSVGIRGEQYLRGECGLRTALPLFFWSSCIFKVYCGKFFMFLFSKKYAFFILMAGGVAAGVLFVIKDPSLSPQDRLVLSEDEQVLLHWQEEWRKNIKRLSPQDAYAAFAQNPEHEERSREVCEHGLSETAQDVCLLSLPSP
jgi:hypothetical protein